MLQILTNGSFIKFKSDLYSLLIDVVRPYFTHKNKRKAILIPSLDFIPMLMASKGNRRAILAFSSSQNFEFDNLCNHLKLGICAPLY